MKGCGTARGLCDHNEYGEKLTYLQLWVTRMGNGGRDWQGEGQIMQGLMCPVKEFGSHLLIYEKTLKHFKQQKSYSVSV